MQTDINKALYLWFSSNKDSLAEAGLELEYFRNPNSSGSCLDVFSSSWVGRSTVWETGECDCEVLNASGQQVLWRHHEGINATNLGSLIAELVFIVSNESLAPQE
ncbi:hypothetical protein BH09SUM1_BH09SUM1_21610 [soil metagenome]